MELTLSLASGMQHVGREEWDACATAGGELNPFLLHDFLLALEESGSAVKEQGWLPQHVLVRRSDTGELLGCAPMYLKVRGAAVGVGSAQAAGGPAHRHRQCQRRAAHQRATHL